MNIPNSKKNGAGFSLIEVLIAVVILSFGLLALAALQSGLFRAGAESKARANATQLAQQALEDARTFAYTQSPGAGYTFNTYSKIGTADLPAETISGVAYKGCLQVRRFVYDNSTKKFVAKNSVNYSVASSGGVLTVTCSDTAIGSVVAFDPATPEFKEIKVAVAWPGAEGEVKAVQVADSIAAISPSDSIQVLKTPIGTAMGPQVYIVPPTGTGVVPIAIGKDANDNEIAAASSNPKPEQFVDDVSSVTTFNVQTFTGDQASGEVLLNRQLAVAAASCVCTDDGVSTTAKPAYAPTVWNGKQLAYTEPDVVVGKNIGAAVVSNSDSEVQTLCTACCRDHHDASNTLQPVQVDPYRTHLAGGDHQHYGYAKSGNAYDIDGGLLVPASGAEYVEACRLIRVNGRMRVAVDARQNHLAVTPLNANADGFENSAFVKDYSDFVSAYIKEALSGGLPSGYPSPVAPLPAPSSTVLANYASSVETPAAIALETGDKRQLSDFGLYIDYINQDTLDAYNCAAAVPADNTGDCEGFGIRQPLEFIPFYAVNVANLLSWPKTRAPTVVSVANATFKNGALQDDGGIVTGQSGSDPDGIPVTQTINISNTGLTATQSIDLDDGATSNDGGVSSWISDAQLFEKSGGSTSSPSNTLYVQVGKSSTLTVGSMTITSPAGATLCNYSSQDKAAACTFVGPATISIKLQNFTTAKTTGTTTTITNRKVCFPAEARISSIVYSDDNTTSEAVTANVGILTAQDYTLVINIIDDDGLATCPAGTSLTP